MRILQKLFAALAVLYLPGLWVIAALSESDGGVIVLPQIFIFVLLLAVTWPFYFVYLELGFTVGRIAARETTSRAEQFYGALCLLLALGGAFLLIFKGELAMPILLCEGALVLLRVVGLFAFPAHRHALAVLKSGVTWLITAGLLVALILACILTRELSESRNKQEPEQPRETVAVAEVIQTPSVP